MAARKNNRFVPTFETLEAREVATATPIAAPAPLLDYSHVQVFQAGAPVVIDADAPQALTGAPTATAPTGANRADPLFNDHRTYVGMKDLRKGDILLNTTNAALSNAIKDVTKSNYNHAAIYVGNGKVVEAVGKGVREITLKEFLGDKDIVRVMVLRNGNLTANQQDAVASFAKSKVGAKYNVGGLIGAAVKYKPHNFAYFDRADYFCSQLVAAAFSSAGAALHTSLEQTPGNLADMVNRFNLPANFSPRLTSLGALFDQGYHQSVRDGKDCINLDLTSREQQNLVNALTTRLNRNGGNFSVRLNRLTADNTGTVLAHLTVTRPGMGDFEIYYRISGDSSANTDIVAPKPSKEFDRALSHIRDAVEAGMRAVNRQLHQQYFSGQAASEVAMQTAGDVGAGQTSLALAIHQTSVRDDAQHVAAVDAVFAASFSQLDWAA
jgi:hypothetical protein